jgi:hypothetical protein
MKQSYDFPVEFHPIKTTQTSLKNPGVVIPGKLAVVRTDTNEPLAVVSDKYTFIEHSKVVEGFRSTLGKTYSEEKISLQKNGARMFLKYTMKRQDEVKTGDIVGMQLFAKNSYDGSSQLQLSLGAIRLVCQNGMVINKSIVEFSQKHIGHQSNIDKGELEEKISLLTTNFQKIMPVMQSMTAKKIEKTPDDLFKSEYLKLPTYISKIAQEEYTREGDESVWGFYNSLTFAITHKMRKESPYLAEHYGNLAWDIASQQL